jgi:chromosome segregation ATPase
MSFFSVGNLLTLGITALGFILYHQLNRRNHTLDKVREYSKRVKEELAAFVSEKEAAVHDYIVELGVQQQSAKELMRRLVITDEELASKAAAVAKIDERIAAYDSSLQELAQMTNRVQENLNRIRDESAFVENAAKRISAAEHKLRDLEQNLGNMERRFERENAESLERVSETMVASVQSTVSDLRAEAEAIEGRVEDHREAINTAEQQRAAGLKRDLELINKTLSEAVEKAGLRADKMEDAALVKLREQALERVRRFQTAVEEKLKSYQENAKTRVAEVQGLARTYKEEWKTDNAEMEAKLRSFRDEWKKDTAELNGLSRTMREEWKHIADTETRQSRELSASLEASSAAAEERITAAAAAADQRLREAREDAEAAALKVGEDIHRVLAEAENQARVRGDADLERWRLEAEELDQRGRKLLADFEADAGAAERAMAAKSEDLGKALDSAAAERERIIDARAEDLQRTLTEKISALEERLGRLGKRIEDTEGSIEDVFSQAMGEAETLARDSAEEGLARWKSTAEEAFNGWRGTIEDGEGQTRRLLVELTASTGEVRKRLTAELEALDKRLTEFDGRTGEAMEQMEGRILRAAGDAEQKALEAADARLAEYREAQTLQYKNLETLADDTAKLDGELRRYMQDTVLRVQDDFALFERDSQRNRDDAAGAFTAALEALRGDMRTLEQDLAALKTRAYENVSEKLSLFEDDFSGDLSRRRDEADRHLAEWKINLDADLEALAEKAGEERRKLEQGFTETLKTQLSDQRDRLVMELEHLKAETAAFEEGIRDEMGQGEESLGSFRNQLDEDLAETRRAAELSVKAEIGRYALTAAETLKQAQRDLSASLKGLADQIENRGGELARLQESSRRDLEEWQTAFSSQLRETDLTMEELRRKIRELAADGDERLGLTRSMIEELREEAAAHRTEIFARTDDQAKLLDSAIREADRHIKEFVGQTKLFDQADALKLDLERHIEDLRGDLDRIDQRRSEAAELEAQFVKIKRLEDEVNAKMTRFLSEKRRIELMETDFNRLLQTSQAVEEKLTQVTASDDTLQAIQVQIRKLEDALTDAEDKYQRVERKNQTLENTNEGIDRNFKALRDSEEGLKRFNEDLHRLQADQQDLRASVERVSAEHEKVREMAEKLSFLDEELAGIEERIEEMRKAREWLARTETRLTELDKEMQGQFKLMDSIRKDDTGRGESKGAPPIGTQERVRSLALKGWSAKEIASAYKLSIGEVELILEIGPKE